MDEKLITIESKLVNKTPLEKADIKSVEISKLDCSGIYIRDNFQIEIIGPIKQILVNGQSGIELFAKGWKNGKQLGFGTNGTVEIERFRIFNPPVLVSDPNGTIIREWVDEKTGEPKQSHWREDPKQAVLDTLFYNVKAVGKENAQIIKGSIGNTTSTFYPVAGESTPCDGRITNSGTVYSTVHDASAGTSVAMSAANPNIIIHGFETPTYTISRSGFGFNISSIGADVISSATFSVAGDGGAPAAGDTDSIDIVSFTPASTNTFVVGDFDQFGTTVYANKTIASWTSTNGVYNDFTISAAGITYISAWASLIGFLGFRYNKDTTSSAPLANNGCTGYMADQTGTSSDPKLVLVHAAAGGGDTSTSRKFTGMSLLGVGA